MRKLVFLLLIIAHFTSAQSLDSLFVSANENYRNGEYEKAIKVYEEIINQNAISAELYYNLGNAYYKLNKVGPSIFYYEKALQLNPQNQDVKNNLVFAKRLALDNIEAIPKTLLQKLNANYLQQLTYNQWAIVAVLLAIVSSLMFLLFYFAEIPKKKRLYFTTSMIGFLLLIITTFITYKQYSQSKKNIQAIVFATKTEVRNAPTFNSEEIFTLHEGTKVTVLDTIDNWKKIKIADGKQGWIISEEIKLLSSK